MRIRDRQDDVPSGHELVLAAATGPVNPRRLSVAMRSRRRVGAQGGTNWPV